MQHRLPQHDKEAEKMQGHWVMARLGKKVLRPGGMELTHKMLDSLDITSDDSVIEFAPGLGATATHTLAKKPAEYTAIDREGTIAGRMKSLLDGTPYQCIKGEAQETGLPDSCAEKVYSEAILTMHNDTQKRAVIKEANRLLRHGGLYAIHEVGIHDASADESVVKAVHADLTREIKVGARPLPNSDWKRLFEEEGFEIVEEHIAPFHLLEPYRIIADEGFFGALRFFFNVIRRPRERKVVLNMKRVFRKHEKSLCAIALIARKVAN